MISFFRRSLVNSRRFFIVFGLLAVFFTACTTIKYIPVKETEYVTVRDSVYFRDTLVRVELEKARLSDFCDLTDTLVLSTDLARSTAYLDSTSGKLKGTLENIKKYVEKPVQIKEKIVYRDSVTTKEIPVPVEVEKIVKKTPLLTKIFAWIGFAALMLLAGSLVWRFAKT